MAISPHLEKMSGPQVLGAAYSLAWGDLKTCIALIEKYLDQVPHSGAGYALMTHAYGGLSDWVNAAKSARLAFCFGIRDPKITSILCGLYQVIDRHELADYISTLCDVHPKYLKASIDPNSYDDIRRVLTEKLRLPRAKKTHSASKEEGVRRRTTTADFSSLPSWLNRPPLDEWGDEEINRPLPSWLVNSVEGLDNLEATLSDLPSWLERPIDLDLEFDVSHEIRSREETPASNNVAASSMPHSKQLTASYSFAQQIGITGELSVAMEIERLILNQSDKPAREVKGPLLLCLSESKLIICPHDGSELRQNPWAFGCDQLASVNQVEDCVELKLVGTRSLQVWAGNQSIATSLSEQLAHSMSKRSS